MTFPSVSDEFKPASVALDPSCSPMYPAPWAIPARAGLSSTRTCDRPLACLQERRADNPLFR